MKKRKLLFAALIMTASINITAFAGQWQQDSTGWWYQNDDGSYTTSDWQNIDGKNYLFDSAGYMRTGWVKTVTGKWYYLNSTGEIRYDDLTENDVVYHFDSNGFCTNPNGDSSFDADCQSIIDQERLEAQKRLSDQKPSANNGYEESIVYQHDVSSQPPQNRFGLADMDIN